MKKHIVLTVSLLTLAACTPHPGLKHAQYWQRASASSALYTQGPKAQQMLHQDIARCTNEINELERLGAIRRATPADDPKLDPKSPEGKMAAWDSPERDGSLYAEHLDYHDFEGCMTANGWERVEYLPYEVAERGRNTWLDTVIGHGHRTKTGERDPKYEEPKGDYDTLNQ